MRLAKVDSVSPGTVAGSDLYDPSGSRILKRGEALSEAHQFILKEIGTGEIYVLDDHAAPAINVFSGEWYERAIKLFARLASNITPHVNSDQLDGALEEVTILVGDLIQLLSGHGRQAVLHLPTCPSKDHLPFHSAQVCAYSILTGMELGYERESLVSLGVGAFLHDIGLLTMERDLHAREDEFSRQEIMEHSWRGYELLKRFPRIGLDSLFIILQHHERFDGSGYPQGLLGNDIPEICRIVAVADCYDALTTNRFYRPRVLPSESAQFIRNSAAQSFDQGVVVAMFRRVSLYPVGLFVVMNNGKSGYVVSGKPESPSRPVVRVRENGAMIDCDLSRELYLFIERAMVGER